MLRTRLQSDRIRIAGLLVTLIALDPLHRAAPADATAAAARPVSLVLPALADCQMAGPFATLRQANEVAAEARRRGQSAVAYHDGDGYYVRAC